MTAHKRERRRLVSTHTPCLLKGQCHEMSELWLLNQQLIWFLDALAKKYLGILALIESLRKTTIKPKVGKFIFVNVLMR